MKILEAIREAEKLRASDIDEQTMIRWLSRHDGQVWRDVIRQYVGGNATPLPEYTAETDIETQELLIPEPWDELYPFFLAMRIDLAQEEMELYTADGNVYGTLYQQWLNDYTRTHRMISVPYLRF